MVVAQFLIATDVFANFGFDKSISTLYMHFEDYHGIGNRLKKLISYVRYYKPQNINIFWTDKGWVSAKFFDLFEFKYPAYIREYNHPMLINDTHP